jgi:hypothetical protein
MSVLARIHRGKWGASYDSGVQYQNVQSLRLGKEGFRRSLNGGKAREITLDKPHIHARCNVLDLVDGFLSALLVPRSKPQLRWAMLGEFQRRLLADTSVGARDWAW